MHNETGNRFFSTTEDRILSAWFDTPTAVASFEWWRFARNFQKAPVAGLDSAVAEIVLTRLPQRVSGHTARRLEDRQAGRIQLPNPQALDGRARLLFAVNWIDGAADAQQASSYRLGWVPFYERYIVTESLQKRDGEPGHSALGHFPATSDVIGACREIVLAHWAEQLEKGGRSAFGAVRRAGLVQKNTVACWAGLIWEQDCSRVSRDSAIDELLESRNEYSVMGFHRA